MSDAGPLAEDLSGFSAELTELTGLTEVTPAAMPGPAPDREPRAFALGNEAFRPTARLAGLERMGERLALRIRGVIEPFARVRTQVTAEPLETLRFEEWRGRLPGFTSLSLYRMRPLKSGLLMAIEPEFVAWLVDAFYGGGGGPAAKAKAREFTPSEERLLGRLTDGIVERVVEVWSEVAALTATLANRETNAAYASLVRGDEAIVLQRFVVAPAQGPAASVSIVFALGALRPYEALLAAKVHDEGAGADGEWRYRLARALEEVRLPVRSVLARPELSLAQLGALKPGDVIPITLDPKVPLIVANRRIATGTIGEQEGRAALMIDQIEQVER